MAGPRPGETLSVRTRRRLRGGASPWVYPTERYRDGGGGDGRRALVYSNATHFYKLVDDGDALRAVDSVRIDRDAIASFGWNHLQLPRQHLGDLRPPPRQHDGALPD